MARTALPAPTKVTRSGVTAVTPTALDAVNGNTLANDGATYFDITNTDTASHTVTINIVGQLDGIAPTSPPKTIAAGATKRYANFPVSIYGSAMQINTDSALVKIASYRNANN
jgi:hypothetical protein